MRLRELRSRKAQIVYWWNPDRLVVLGHYYLSVRLKHLRPCRNGGLKQETLRLMQSLARLQARLPVLSDPTAQPNRVVAALDDVTPVALALLPSSPTMPRC